MKECKKKIECGCKPTITTDEICLVGADLDCFGAKEGDTLTTVFDKLAERCEITTTEIREIKESISEVVTESANTIVLNADGTISILDQEGVEKSKTTSICDAPCLQETIINTVNDNLTQITNLNEYIEQTVVESTIIEQSILTTVNENIDQITNLNEYVENVVVNTTIIEDNEYIEELTEQTEGNTEQIQLLTSQFASMLTQIQNLTTQVQSQNNQIPIGTVISIDSENPTLPDCWIELMGQAIPKADYPELYNSYLITKFDPVNLDPFIEALYGETATTFYLADRRGLFEVGHGSNADNSGENEVFEYPNYQSQTDFMQRGGNGRYENVITQQNLPDITLTGELVSIVGGLITNSRPTFPIIGNGREINQNSFYTHEVPVPLGGSDVPITNIPPYAVTRKFVKAKNECN